MSTADGSRPFWSQRRSVAKDRPAWAPVYAPEEDDSPMKKRRLQAGQPSHAPVKSRLALSGFIGESKALKSLQEEGAAVRWPQESCPFCGATVICKRPQSLLEAFTRRQRTFQCKGHIVHIWPWSFNSMFYVPCKPSHGRRKNSGLHNGRTPLCPSEAVVLLWDFSRDHNKEDLCLSTGKNHNGSMMKDIWEKLHNLAYWRGKSLQDNPAAGATRGTRRPLCILA